MLTPPRVGEVAAYASLRQDSLVRPDVNQSRVCQYHGQPLVRGNTPTFLRQSLQRLGRFVDRRHALGRNLSHHPLGLTIDSSDTSASNSPVESSFGEIESVTTFSSGDTLRNDVPSHKPVDSPEELSILCIDAEKFPHFVGNNKAKLALSLSLQKMRMGISQIDIHFQDGHRFSWCKPKSIIELPKAVRKEIWRNAVVSDRKLFICSCFYCRANAVVATQPPLTRTSRIIRAETLPIFYEENDFQHPLSHPGNSSVRAWLNSIGPENRALLRHLELTFLNTERAIESLDVHYRMRPAREAVFVENVMWDDGEMGEMEWHVFTAQEAGAELEVGVGAAMEVEVVDGDEDAKSIGTEILFDQGEEEEHEATNELEFEVEADGSNSENDWETISSSGESTLRLLAPSTPPQVHLTRKNGEDFGNPRWSFAGKFNDHVVRRLASLHRDPYQKVPRKPVPFTIMPSLVVASDRPVEDDTKRPMGRGFDLAVEKPTRPVSKRHSGVSWVVGC